jgi:hypothetical protein
LTFNGEVLNSKMVFPIIGQTLVEGAVLFWSDVRWVASPDRFRLVKLLVRGLALLDLFGFLLLFLLLFLVNLLNLGLLILILLFFLFLLIFYLLQRRLPTATYEEDTLDIPFLPPW